ncbi:MAG: hypothetical protein RR357_06470, partial [Clostridia bacterium]
QGNIYVNGDLTLRGVDLGRVLPTLYETRFGDVVYWNRAGQKREAGKGEPGEAMFYPYIYNDNQPSGKEPPPVETKYHSRLMCQVAEINNKEKGQFGDIAPMQLYTEDSRPIISIKVDGKDTQIEGYYNENGILRKLNSEVESEKPVIGEFMYKSPTEKFIGGCPNYVPRYVVGGNIYCSGNLIIDKANQGFITYEQVIKDPTIATYNYVYSCAMPINNEYGGIICERPIPNQSAIRGDIFVQGKMIYAPDNLGVNNTENGKDWSDKTLKKMDSVGIIDKISADVMSKLTGAGFTFSDKGYHKRLTWNRWNVKYDDEGEKQGHYVVAGAGITGYITNPQEFTDSVNEQIKLAANALYSMFSDVKFDGGVPTDNKSIKVAAGIANKFKELAGITIDKPLMTRVPSMIDGNQKNIYTQMIISGNTDIYINNQKKSNGGYVPYGNSSSTLFYSTLNAHGRTIEAAKGDKDSSNGLEKNFAVEGYTAALTVKFHDKFNCSSIYANGEIATVSSNIDMTDDKFDCKIITNLGKEGATVRGTNLVTSQYDMWNFGAHNQAIGKNNEGVLSDMFDKIAQTYIDFNVNDVYDGKNGYMKGDTLVYNALVRYYGIYSSGENPLCNMRDSVFGTKGTSESGDKNYYNKNGSMNLIKREKFYDAFNA